MSTSPVEQSVEVSAAVLKFLATPLHKSFVGGGWVEAEDNQTFDVVDPGSAEKIATVTSFKKADVDKAVGVADHAFQKSGWAKMQVAERAACLHRIADAVETRKADFAAVESLDCGKIYNQALGDVQNFIDTFRYFADLSQAVNYRQVIAVKNHEAWVSRKPWGPCGFIIPWNFPFLLAGWGLAPALAAGNTCVLKPAEDTPLSSLYLCRIIQELDLLPEGVLNVVTGLGETAGAAISQNPKFRRMSFTGSPEVGRMVAEAAGRNLIPVKCELGGKGAAVIFNDVDIQQTAEKLVQAITFHSGQVCCDATRWLIQSDIYDDFVGECVTRMKSVQVGYQMDSKAQMGPVVSSKQRTRVLSYLKKGVADGADLLLEGGEAHVPGKKGFYVKPALLAGSLNNVAAREEIFGPVAFLAPFSSEEDGVRLANDTEYGLGNSVWSKDLQRCARVAEAFVAGNGWINAHNVVVHGVPYGGVGKSGMGGGVVSPDTLNDYLRPISVVRPL
ncbi:MAG: aldehyde dehydrogenase family protein [Planctomycetales bacterium]|jgi:aldehyde dehydrogenase (NAD+)|nr:aldehyde dehydrogenase family protein [Planctomycetales bacterium]